MNASVPPTTQFRIVLDDLRSAEIARLLRDHAAELRSVSPPESAHVFDLDRLRTPDTTMWSMWDGEVIVGCAALKDLGERHGELKSMRVDREYTGRGLATMLLRHILGEASARGFRQVSLETGSMAFFEPARRLYRKHGFVDCNPFGAYRDDPNSVFMTLMLQGG